MRVTSTKVYLMVLIAQADRVSEIYQSLKGGVMLKAVKKLWKDESAQGATEYILMLVVVVSIAFLFRDQIKTIIQTKTNKLGEDINNF